jgi:homoserine dehydrogenase
MRTYRLVLAGLGNVGRSLLELLLSQADLLRDRYGLALVVVGAADSGGAALAQAGLDPAAILAAKRAGSSVASLAGAGRPGLTAAAMLQKAEADLLLESTLTNLRDGQPGLDLMRAALGRGMHVVSANKGPIVLAYDELHALATYPRGPGLRFSACVGGLTHAPLAK